MYIVHNKEPKNLPEGFSCHHCTPYPSPLPPPPPPKSVYTHACCIIFRKVISSARFHHRESWDHLDENTKIDLQFIRFFCGRGRGWNVHPPPPPPPPPPGSMVIMSHSLRNHKASLSLKQFLCEILPSHNGI